MDKSECEALLNYVTKNEEDHAAEYSKDEERRLWEKSVHSVSAMQTLLMDEVTDYITSIYQAGEWGGKEGPKRMNILLTGSTLLIINLTI